MKRPLWVQKLSDDRLKQMLIYVQDIEILGITKSEEVLHIIDTWYSHINEDKRLITFSMDVLKEVACRWQDQH